MVGDTVIVKLTSDEPVFGVIICVVLHSNVEPQLVIDNLETIGYNNHFCAYEVKPLSVRCVTVTSPGELADQNIVNHLIQLGTFCTQNIAS